VLETVFLDAGGVLIYPNWWRISEALAAHGVSVSPEALSQAASKTVSTMANAEQVSVQALKGDADTRQVVDAVMSAQQALQTAVAIRDKVVSAYLEVSRMGI